MERSKKYKGVYKKQLMDGDISYYVTYKDRNGKKIWLKIGKKSEGITEIFCNNKRNQIISKMRLGDEAPLVQKQKNKFKTLNDIAKLYFEYLKSNKSYGGVISVYNRHIKDVFGNKDINQITASDIEKFKIKKLDEVSPRTVNQIIQTIGTIYNYNIKYHDLNVVNPVVKVKKLKLDNKRERFLTLDEIKKLYEKVKQDDELYLFTKLSLTTGGRLTTVVEIKVKDIDFKNKVINLKDYKNNSTYAGYLVDEIIELLKKQIKNNNLEEDDNIFRYSKKMIQDRLKKILDDLFNRGLDKKDRKNRVVIHTLRHTFASHLAINGTPIYTIQKLMNHSDIKMTMRYAKLAPDREKN